MVRKDKRQAGLDHLIRSNAVCCFRAHVRFLTMLTLRVTLLASGPSACWSLACGPLLLIFRRNESEEKASVGACPHHPLFNTIRPPSRVTASSVPGMTLSRSRIAFGITTCPLLVSRVVSMT